MFRRILIVLFALTAAAAVVTPNAVLACEACRVSPDHKFAFCKTLYPTQYGLRACTTVVTDPFNGNTACQIDNTECGPSYPDNPFQPPVYGGGGGDPNFCWSDYYFYSVPPNDPASAKGRIRPGSKASASSHDKTGAVGALMISQDPGYCTFIY